MGQRKDEKRRRGEGASAFIDFSTARFILDKIALSGWTDRVACGRASAARCFPQAGEPRVCSMETVGKMPERGKLTWVLELKSKI